MLEYGSRKPDEIIIVDDMSFDNTAETVKNYADQFRDVQISYIPYVRQDTGWANPAKPRNVGIRFTNPAHEIIIYTEPEMLWMKNTLETLMGFFENPPATLAPRYDQSWLPHTPRPEKFFLLVSSIGYVHNNMTEGEDRWRNPELLFGHQEIDRRYPEINTRVAAVKREDVFRIGGWDERFVGWGQDDSDHINRLQMSGVECICLDVNVKTIHLWHENPPADGRTADRNHLFLQDSLDRGIIHPNDENWGLLPVTKTFGTEIDDETWKKIQEDELLSWTQKAWPSVDGKLQRERKYLAQALSDLGLNELGLPDGDLVDIGCGPLSIMELMEVKDRKCFAVDPLHNGYETIRKWDRAPHVIYKEGRGEKLSLQEIGVGEVALVTSINGIDHYESPKETLRQISLLLAPHGVAALHFCVNNASKGHPHPAHRIDLTPEHIKEWAKEFGLVVEKNYETHYGWRHQLSSALILRKTK